MKKYLNVFFVLLTIMLVSSCIHVNGSIDTDQPSQVKTAGEEKVLDQFSRINVAGSMQVFYIQGDKYTVLIDAPQELMEKIVVYVKAKELNIGCKKETLGSDLFLPLRDVKIFVTSPSIKEIDLTGSGNLTTKGEIKASRLDVGLTGAGNMNFEGVLSCNYLDVDLTGSGNMKFSNVTADKMVTDVTGSGNVDYSSIAAGRVESDITGVGNIKISGKTSEHIKNVTGLGNVDDAGLTVEK